MTRETETPTTDDRTDTDHRRADQGDRPRGDGDGSSPHDGPPADVTTSEGIGSAPPDDPEPGPVSGTAPDPPTPADPSAGTGVDADPEGVLTPADQERVAERVRELDDERVLVPTDSADGSDGRHGPEASPTSGAGPRDGPPSGGESRPGGSGEAPSGATDPLDGSTGTAIDGEAAYAVDVTVRTDHGLAAESFRSNDVRVAFEELLRWYAGRIDPATDPERVLEVLLAGSDLDVTVR
jgi:hypothetical protein